MTRYPIEILLVEDSPSDQLLAREALVGSGVPSNLHIVNNGVDAMDFLLTLGNYHAAPTPDFILLDLNLPKKDGREVLAEIKNHDGLKHIPVIVLTTSESDQDVEQAYLLQANCYICKPVSFEAFNQVVGAMLGFWCDVVRLPRRRAI